MDTDIINEWMDLGNQKYDYINEVCDKYCKFQIKRYCRLFYYFYIYREELKIMIKKFNNETKRLLLKTKFCCDITDEIISYL